MTIHECLPLPPVPPGTVEERARARLAAAALARDADDLRFILDVLALWPAQDHRGVTTAM